MEVDDEELKLKSQGNAEREISIRRYGSPPISSKPKKTPRISTLYVYHPCVNVYAKLQVYVSSIQHPARVVTYRLHP